MTKRSPAIDTPIAPELARYEPLRTPEQDLSAVATGPFDPCGQPLPPAGFLLGLADWNRHPWPKALHMVVEAERLGFAFALAAQADGEDTLDAFACSYAVAAETRRIVIAPTVSLRSHLHPLHVARFVGNLDHIAGGRGALCLAAGDDAVRARFLGLEPASAADGEADEFVTLVKHAWTVATPFNFAGRYFSSRRAALVGPRPLRLPRPFLALAGGADAVELAARSFDWLLLDAGVAVDFASAARDRAALAYGRRLQILATINVTEAPGPHLISELTALAGIEGVEGALIRFADGMRGLHEFGSRVLPAFRANAMRSM